MMNEQEQIRDLAKRFSTLVASDMAPDEIEFISPWVDGYLDSGKSLDQVLEENGSTDAFMGFGSVEFATALIAPIVVEIVKALMPYILERISKKKTDIRLAQYPGVQLVMKKKKDEILFSIKTKGKNKKADQKAIDRIFESILNSLDQ